MRDTVKDQFHSTLQKVAPWSSATGIGVIAWAATTSDTTRFTGSQLPFVALSGALLFIFSASFWFASEWKPTKMVYAVGFVVGGVIAAVAIWLGGRNLPRAATPRVWGPEAQANLVETLRPYGGSEASMKVLFSRADQRIVADGVISAFDLAGWTTDLTVIPLDRWLNDAGYFNGLEVQGYNRALVESIGDALKDVGHGEVRVRVDELKVPQSNPKWPWANRRVKITLGHATAERPAADRSFEIDKLDPVLKQYGLKFDGLSSPQPKPTPETDASPCEYVPLQDGRYLRVTGASWTPQQREVAKALVWVHETELRARR